MVEHHHQLSGELKERKTERFKVPYYNPTLEWLLEWMMKTFAHWINHKTPDLQETACLALCETPGLMHCCSFPTAGNRLNRDSHQHEAKPRLDVLSLTCQSLPISRTLPEERGVWNKSRMKDGLFSFQSSRKWIFLNLYGVKMMTKDDKRCISAALFMLLCPWLSCPSENTCIWKHTYGKYVVALSWSVLIGFWDENPWNKQLFICQIIGCRRTVLISVTDCWPLERTVAVIALELRKIMKRQIYQN